MTKLPWCALSWTSWSQSYRGFVDQLIISLAKLLWRGDERVGCDPSSCEYFFKDPESKPFVSYHVLQFSDYEIPFLKIYSINQQKIEILWKRVTHEVLKHSLVFQTCSIAHVVISSWSSDSLQRIECSLHKANEASGVSLKRNRVSVEEIYMCGKMNVRSNEMTLSISTFQNSDLFPIIHWPPMAICYCRGGEHGQMVGCDNDDCPYQWFHLDCLKLKAFPKSKTWYCPECQKQRRGKYSRVQRAD